MTKAIEALIAKGESALRAGDFDDAIRIFESILEQDPQNARALQLLTDTRVKRREEKLNKVKVWINDALVHFEGGNTRSAEALLEQALEVGRDNPDIAAYLKREGIEEHLRNYRTERQVKEALDEATEKLRYGAYTDALQSLEDLTSPSASQLRTQIYTAQQASQKSVDEFQAENYAEAFRQARTALALAPDDAKALNYQKLAGYWQALQAGDQARQERNYSFARQQYEEALKFQPGDTAIQDRLKDLEDKERLQAQLDAQMAQARNARQAQRFDEAMQILEDVLDADAHQPKAIEELTLTRREKAEAQKRKAQDLATGGENALGAGQLDEAEQSFNQALKLDPENELARLGLGKLAAAQKKRQRAEDMLRAGRAALDAKDYELAERSLREALSNVADPGAVQQLLDKVNLQKRLREAGNWVSLKRYKQALDALTQLKATAPADPEVQRLLTQAEIGWELEQAQSLMDANELEQAKQALLKFKERLGAPNPEVNALLEIIEHREKQAKQIKARVDLARSAMLFNDYAKARRDYEAVLSDPETPESLRLEALQGLNEVRQLQQTDATTKFNTQLRLAREALERQELETAKNYLNEAEKIQKTERLDAGELPEVLDQIQRAQARQKRVISYLEAGLEALNSTNYSEAVRVLELGKQEDQANKEVETLLREAQTRLATAQAIAKKMAQGATALDHDQYEVAWRVVGEVLAQAPQQAEAHDLQARILRRVKQAAEAPLAAQQLPQAHNALRTWRLLEGETPEVIDFENRLNRVEKIQVLFQKAQAAASRAEELRLLKTILQYDSSNGDVRAQVEDLETALRQEQQFARSLQLAADAAATDQYTEAVRHYKQAAEIAPTEAQKSEVESLLAKTQQAQQAFGETHLRQAQEQLGLKDFKAADLATERALNAIPTGVFAETATKLRQEIKRQEDQHDDLEERLRLIKYNLDNEAYELAETNLQTALAAHPSQEELLGLSSLVLKNKKEQAAIDADLKEAQQAYRVERYAEVIALYQDILRRQPNHPQASRNLSRAEAALTKHQELFADLDALLSTGQMALARERYDQLAPATKETPEATAFSAELIHREKKIEFDKQRRTGEAALAQKDYAAAVALLESAERLNPEDIVTQNLLKTARAELEASNKAHAALALEKARVAYDQGDYTEAARQAGEAYKLAPNDEAKRLLADAQNKIDEENQRKADEQMRQRRQRRLYLAIGAITLGLIILITFLAADGPSRLAAWLAPASTPTATPTRTPTATPSFTPTSTPLPTQTFTPTPQPYPAKALYNIGIYANPQLTGDPIALIGKGQVIYLCAQSGNAYLISYGFCHLSKPAGWGKASYVQLLFAQPFVDLVTITPFP